MSQTQSSQGQRAASDTLGLALGFVVAVLYVGQAHKLTISFFLEQAEPILWWADQEFWVFLWMAVLFFALLSGVRLVVLAALKLLSGLWSMIIVRLSLPKRPY